MLKPSTVKWLSSALKEGSCSRSQLARELCRRDDWRNPFGDLCAASARKRLPRLAAELGLELPVPRRRAGGCRRRSRQALQPVHPSLKPQCSFRELGAVRRCRSGNAAERRCAGLLDAEHPLGRDLAPGCRLVRGVTAQGQDLGVISFVAAPLRLGPLKKRSESSRGLHVHAAVPSPGGGGHWGSAVWRCGPGPRRSPSKSARRRASAGSGPAAGAGAGPGARPSAGGGGRQRE